LDQECKSVTAAALPRSANLTPQQTLLASRLLLLVFLGLVSFAGVKQDQRECRPFTFGVSAFGSCDYLGGTTLPSMPP
jgi:hypothetical protein